MSLATTLEYMAHEQGSMEIDEALDYLIQLRDEIEKRIERLRNVERIDRFRKSPSANEGAKQ